MKTTRRAILYSVLICTLGALWSAGLVDLGGFRCQNAAYDSWGCPSNHAPRAECENDTECYVARRNSSTWWMCVATGNRADRCVYTNYSSKGVEVRIYVKECQWSMDGSLNTYCQCETPEPNEKPAAWGHEHWQCR